MRKSGNPSSHEPDREPRAQFAALPWRVGPVGEVEVLLITSRETHRWVIPKGWPIKGKSSSKSAAQEAFEEAGVQGKVGKKPFGGYAYDKRLKNGRLQRVRVAVFPLQVENEAETYLELGQREKLWLPPSEAARKVDEPELMVLLATFHPDQPDGPKAKPPANEPG
ncbi:MAG TPA: NUDIX hydrolase [Phenylobacterium sp.]|uniref:NUDIX hydrolase n=1 Tax=Phenylobacterium sp. TaxID=1871053 RepID=UPI002D234FC9|nr:NUDIX hydrolase [Phenylobacterium sp.]HZZ67692.1 NUDIX hydrolase [Phenylobacterium sp.]